MKKGLYVVLEGIDGSGKSTQCSLLAKWLEQSDKKVRLVREHTWGKIGTLLRREYLEGNKDYPEVDGLLYAADRMELMYEIVRPAVSEGYIVVSDRSYISSLAYQGAQGIDTEWIKDINKYASRPDVVIYIDTNPKTCIARVKGEDKFEKLDFLEKVRSMYNSINSILPDYSIICINGNRSIEEIHEEIKGVMAPKL